MKNVITHLIALLIGLGIGYLFWSKNKSNPTENKPTPDTSVQIKSSGMAILDASSLKNLVELRSEKLTPEQKKELDEALKVLYSADFKDDLSNNSKYKSLFENLLNIKIMSIGPKEAVDMVEDRKANITSAHKGNKIDMLHSETFTSFDEIKSLINNSEANGFRIYMGIRYIKEGNDSIPAFCTILCGIDKRGKEMVGTEQTHLMVEYGIPCPPRCQDIESKIPHTLSAKP